VKATSQSHNWINKNMKRFSARIQLIGVNPYVLLPPQLLKELFTQAGRNKGPIPVKLVINGKEFIQHLVKYNGKWRLYLNTPMRKIAKKETGDEISIRIMYDAGKREIPRNNKFDQALNKNQKAKQSFSALPAYRRKEIVRYINSLKTEESIDRNIQRAIHFLLGKERFAGRDGSGEIKNKK
jgi:hypothetical protein